MNLAAQLEIRLVALTVDCWAGLKVDPWAKSLAVTMVVCWETSMGPR